jgi:hypothetical protein
MMTIARRRVRLGCHRLGAYRIGDPLIAEIICRASPYGRRLVICAWAVNLKFPSQFWCGCITPVENLAHLSAIDARIDYRRSFRHVIADLLDEFLNWTRSFFATIGLLLVRPWNLTNQFLTKRLPLAGPPSQHAQD